MSLQPFTSNFADNSTDAGFQFTFFCDLCREGYKTKFVESKTHKKAGLLRGLGRAVSIGTSLLGKYGTGYTIERGADILTERYQGMSPDWHKEHEVAFELAQNEAKQHFHRCPKCKKWVCENDWNEQEGLCVDDAPRVNVEVAAAKAQKAVQDIHEKAAGTQVFTGEIESKQTLCSQCGKPAGEGKFCNNCGGPLDLIKCPKCGAKNFVGTRFCGECGTKLG
ncbi:MAG: zinc ribbon domain-containing protein [Endomicrobiia bacterium]|nr:zinc ribbon domain-containing protein [Endomicrobiia bacterium]